MTGPDQVRALLTELAEARGIYWIAKRTGKQYVQIVRMIANGRCQPGEFEELQRLRSDVQRETLRNYLQNVISRSLS